ncbi:serine hydrolase family protein [Candidatus Saccharibacteria bacterium]|nr:serine hydrolase family protein [Candidatus Saccharibacteria bacterium]
MKYVIIHGSFGSPEDNWFPWLKNKLETDGNKVLAPSFPVDSFEAFTKAGNESFEQEQNLESWRKAFSEQVIPFVRNEPASYITHSLGPIFLVRMLLEFNLKAKKSILVAPFYRHLSYNWQFKKANQSFCDDNFEFKDSAERLGDSHVLIGSNDPYVPIEYSKDFAIKTSSTVHIVDNGGHMNSESGFTEFEQLAVLI